MSDMNRLGELERISLTELNFLVGCFEVCSLNFIVIVWLRRGERIRLLWCIYISIHIYVPLSLIRSNFNINLPHHHWPCLLFLPVRAPLPWPPAIPLPRAIDPWGWEFTWGQHCLWPGVKAEWVKWDWICPPCCQEPWRSGWPVHSVTPPGQ